MTRFAEIYSAPAIATASAPGRVNLMGDHTDYNEGLVLPIAIPQRTTVQVGWGEGCHRAYSATLNRHLTIEGDEALADFGRYIGGCFRVLEERGVAIPPLNLLVESQVPVGAGLSSSAALEVATLRAVCAVLSFPASDIEIANLAWRAETAYAGVNCGIMDQMACVVAETDRMLFLDTRDRSYRQVPLPPGCEIVVIDSGVERSLAASGYNARRAECEAAARALGAASLRDVAEAQILRLPAPLQKRARHVLTENQRVRAALDAEPAPFGSLMNESHASLRDDYGVSHPKVDAIVAMLQTQSSARSRTDMKTPG